MDSNRIWNILVNAIGLVLCGIVLAVLATFVIPNNTTIGERISTGVLSELVPIIRGQRVVETVEVYHSDFLEAPDFWEEFNAQGNDHPVPTDLFARLDAMGGPDAVRYNNAVQYRNYVFVDTYYAVDGMFHLFVYKWDGSQWVFVEEVIYDI